MSLTNYNNNEDIENNNNNINKHSNNNLKYINDILQCKNNKKNKNKKNAHIKNLQIMLVNEYKNNLLNMLSNAGAKIDIKDINELILNNKNELPEHIKHVITPAYKRSKRVKNSNSKKKHQMKHSVHMFNKFVSDITPPEPLLAVTVCDNNYMALCDTGASNCFISKSVAEHIQNNDGQILYEEKKVTLAQGETDIIGIATCKITWNTGSHQQYFYILPELNKDMILGRDFLRRMQINIDISTNSYYYRNNKHQLFQFDVLKQPSCNIINNQDTQEFVIDDWVYLISSQAKCNETQRQEIRKILTEFCNKGLFSKHPGTVTYTEHVIELKNKTPYRSKLRPHNKTRMEIIDYWLDRLLLDDVIEEAESEWASNVVIVPKPGYSRDSKNPQNWRLCCDYRILNQRTKIFSHGMPRIDFVLSQLGKAKVVTTLDLASGYHQLKMNEESKNVTAFITHRGVFRFKKLPFGLVNASFYFQKCMEKILGDILYKYAIAFLDDIIVYSESWDAHLIHLQNVLQKLHNAGFTVNYDKVHIGCESVKILGHIFRDGKISPNPEKVRAIQQYKTPNNRKDVMRLLGLAGFYRSYIPGFSIIAKPLTLLLRKKTRWKWGKEQLHAFNTLKNIITSDTVMALPNMEEPFILQTDASRQGIGCSLSQMGEKGLRPIAFASRTLNRHEENYSITELEMLSVLYACKKFKHYIEYSRTIVETDHSAIKSIFQLEEPNGRLKRWIMRLQGLDITIVHKKGKSMLVSDALSRAPAPKENDEPSQETYVDTVLPLEGETAIDKIQFAPMEATIQDVYNQDNHKVMTNIIRPEVKPLDIAPKQNNSSNTSNITLQNVVMQCNKVPDKIEKWANEQDKDPKLLNIKNRVTKNDKICCNVYSIDNNNVLYKKCHNIKQIVVPSHLINSIIQLNHDTLLGGHLGNYKTFHKIQNNYFWKKMKDSIRIYIKTCHICQQTKPLNVAPYGFLSSQYTTVPSKSISCDLIGPLPKTGNQNEFLFVIVDDCTRYPVVYPIRKPTSKVLATKLIEYSCMFGFCENLRSDNGSQFCSKLWTTLCQELGIINRYSVPYRPQGNITEICNKFIKQLIKSYCIEHKNWDKNINAIAYAIRTAPNEATGYSPAALMFGHELRSPFDINLKQKDVKKKSIHAYVHDLSNRLSQAYLTSQNKCRSARKKYEKQYNKKRTINPFKLGDIVLRTTNTLSSAAKGIAASLIRPYEGPFKIVRQLGPNSYELKTTDNKPAGKRNADQLKMYYEPSEEQKDQVIIQNNNSNIKQKQQHNYNLRNRQVK